MSKLTPTDEQLAVIEAVAGPDSVMVDALAGCAKSSTLEMAAPQVRVPALALAFNKAIADSLKPRLPGNFAVKTFNGLGFGAALKALPQVNRAEIDAKKLGKLVSQVGKDREVNLSGDQWEALRNLVTGVMQAGIVPEDRGRPLTPDLRENWQAVAEDQWMSRDDFEFLYDLAREVLERNNKLTEQGVLSFDDQVYYSTCIAGQFPHYPKVFCDESQDLNRLNHAMLGLSIRDDGQFAIVGDPRQAIYLFRGSDARSMSRIRALRKNWLDRPLMTTFRCPKVIVTRQQEHAPGFKAWHTNVEGAVHQLEPTAQLEGWTWKDIEALRPTPGAKIAVLCRNNAPLLGLAFKLLRSQIGVVMLGRDIGRNLIALSRKILPEDKTDRLMASSLVAAWIEEESSLAWANGKEERVAGITDRGECLIAVLSSGCRDVGELRAMLSKLFSREAGQVELSSIHKAKGLEWPVVVHLDPWRIPSPWAREAAKAGDHRQMEQENNLRYVAETRTKHTLINANLEDYLG